MELMVTPAAQDTTMCRSSMSAPISSRMKGMMCGFTARKSTSLCCTVSLLREVRFTPIFCGFAEAGSACAHRWLDPHIPPLSQEPQHGTGQGLLGAWAWLG